MNKKVLVIVHTFPPKSGVGGRRWAKFAKYLSQQDVDVHILTSKPPLNSTSLWDSDVVDINNINYYNFNYPNVLSSEVLGIFDKFLYKFYLFILPFFVRGNYYDKLCFEENNILKKLNYIVQKNEIKNIIVSGGPFNLLYFVSIFKKENPDINLIVDFRDPWTWGQNFGIKILKYKRKQIEELKENFVIENADFVFTPTEIMDDFLKKKYPLFAPKIKILPHGFDDQFIIPRETQLKIDSGLYKIAYLGELYDNIGYYFDKIACAINKSNSPFLIDIFSDSKRYQDIFLKHNLINKKVNYLNQINATDLFSKLNSYHFILIVQPDFAKDYISTKFYEILYSRIPIIYISKEGLTEEFVLKHRAGICLNISQIDSFFSDNSQVSDYIYDLNFEHELFNLRNLTKIIRDTLV